MPLNQNLPFNGRALERRATHARAPARPLRTRGRERSARTGFHPLSKVSPDPLWVERCLRHEWNQAGHS